MSLGQVALHTTRSLSESARLFRTGRSGFQVFRESTRWLLRSRLGGWFGRLRSFHLALPLGLLLGRQHFVELGPRGAVGFLRRGLLLVISQRTITGPSLMLCP